MNKTEKFIIKLNDLRQSKKGRNKHRDIKTKRLKNKCIVITSHTPQKLGYLEIKIGKYRTKTHREIYRLFIKEKYKRNIKKQEFVCHKCNNAKCVNIEHLYLGTQKDNMRDKIKCNKHSRGELNPRCKLTKREIKKIRKLYKIKIVLPYPNKDKRHKNKYGYYVRRKYSAIKLAKMFNVTRGTIFSIVRRSSWKHLK